MSNLFKAYLLQWRVSSILSHSMAFAWWRTSVIWELPFQTLVECLRAWLLHFKASTARTRTVRSASVRRHGSLRERIIAVNVASVSLRWTIIAPGSIIVWVRETWSTSCNSSFILCLLPACSLCSAFSPSTIYWRALTRDSTWITV